MITNTILKQEWYIDTVLLHYNAQNLSWDVFLILNTQLTLTLVAGESKNHVLIHFILLAEK